MRYLRRRERGGSATCSGWSQDSKHLRRSFVKFERKKGKGTHPSLSACPPGTSSIRCLWGWGRRPWCPRGGAAGLPWQRPNTPRPPGRHLPDNTVTRVLAPRNTGDWAKYKWVLPRSLETRGWEEGGEEGGETLHFYSPFPWEADVHSDILWSA